MENRINENKEGINGNKTCFIGCVYVPAAKILPEFLAEVSEYPSFCLSSASSRAAASWTMAMLTNQNTVLIISVSPVQLRFGV